MQKFRSRAALLIVISFAAALVAKAESPAANNRASDDTKPLPTIAQKTKGLPAAPGFFNFYWDARAGKVWLEIAKFDSDFLYVNSLATGVGSHDFGLDRGQFGDLEGKASPQHVVRFVRVGPKVLLIEQ